MNKPTLYVLSRPSLTDEISCFLHDENQTWHETQATPAEKLIEFAGRICYMSFGSRQSPRNNNEYIINLIRQGHESVLEHVSWTFLLTGVTRAFSHQLVRHRVGFSFSQLSQQYHDDSDANFLIPEGLSAFPEILDDWRDAVEGARSAYKSILSKMQPRGGMPKELLRSIRSAARSVLPNATETKVVFTANARSIRHFLDIRGSIEGDIEMRRVSKLVYEVMKADAPAVVSDFTCEILRDQSPMIVKAAKPVNC